jgi:Secretion system C-terminal sorting domain
MIKLCKTIFILIACIGNLPIHAQNKYGQQWLTGNYGTLLNFKNGNNPPSVRKIFNNGCYSGWALSNICDSATGNLLFTFNGVNIFDTLGNIMLNGSMLHPTDYMNQGGGGPVFPQSNIIIPKGGSLYYIFMPTYSVEVFLDADSNFLAPRCDILYASIVDMSKNNGLGEVVVRNKLIDTNTYLRTSGTSAVRHANGKDWWLVKQGIGSDLHYDTLTYKGAFRDSCIIYTYLVKSDTVEGPFIQRLNSANADYYWDYNSAQLSFSDDGSKIVACSALNMFYGDFDRCTGLVSDAKVLHVPKDSVIQFPGDTAHYITPYYPYLEGVTYSPDKKMIYITKALSVWQYEIGETDSSKAWCKVIKGTADKYIYDNNLGGMYNCNINLATNGKLYIGYGGNVAKTWSIINYPNLKDSACGACVECLAMLEGDLCNVPNMPNYNLGALLPASICWPLGIEPTADIANTISVYPNPAQDKVIFSFGQSLSKSQQLNVLNMQGQVVFSKQLPTGTMQYIMATDLPNGVYVVNVDEQSKRFVIMHGMR